MRIVLLAAVAENGVIGRDGDLPWRLSTDLKRFKANTMGKPIVMGRKTWESFPKRPLPGRLNIVITRNAGYRADGAEVVGSLDDALTLARVRSRCDGAEEICIVGGGEIYRQAMTLADCLKITHVLTEVEGDTSFPAIDAELWREVSSEPLDAGEKDSHSTRYAVYERRRHA
ncbi:dihydrofolate reductase [Pseudaminobacter sp. 19-2017]|uniref:Dihydrofolate reductase n=1 Tax=Pseudaminobacter soli (ex Zhang et al. 2022) TaxID=2831468 RepID=A0A942ICA0_9HYPH|nr:dihydrofolate reductase [Pseudaminobacter soli]MBS3652476.1 dihydrofolate reductase [Pseudaminobacter soli]